jgi:hypothetical protein
MFGIIFKLVSLAGEIQWHGANFLGEIQWMGEIQWF